MLKQRTSMLEDDIDLQIYVRGIDLSFTDIIFRSGIELRIRTAMTYHECEARPSDAYVGHQ